MDTATDSAKDPGNVQRKSIPHVHVGLHLSVTHARESEGRGPFLGNECCSRACSSSLTGGMGENLPPEGSEISGTERPEEVDISTMEGAIGIQQVCRKFS